MTHLSVSWPADGSKNWGAQVDTNLNAIVAQVNQHDDTLNSINGATQGPPGPAGPVPMRFYSDAGWPARPPGTEASPIIDVSTAFPNAPQPTNSVEGDTWFPTGSINSGTSTSTDSSLALFNVLDYGAKGDGATIDRSAIQSAINAANARYVATGSTQTVYVPAGVYLVDAVNYLYEDGTVHGAMGLLLLDGVRLDGVGTIKVKNGAYGSGALYGAIKSKNSGVSAASIRGITVDGNRANQIASRQCQNIALVALTDVQVVGVHAINANGGGIYVVGHIGTPMVDVSIRDCFVTNAVDIAIQCSQFSGLDVDNNTLTDCSEGVDVYGENGTTVSSGLDFRISNNRIRNCGVGIFLETVASGVVTGNHVQGGGIGGTVNRINGAPRDINIVGNTFIGNGIGYRVSGDTSGVSIRNNVITGSTTACVQLGTGGGNVSNVFILDNTLDTATLNTAPLVLVVGNQAAFNRHRGTVTRNTDRSKDASITATTPVSNVFSAANAS